MKKDERLNKLAKSILTNSVKLQAGEKIYIETSGSLTVDLLAAFVEESVKIGAIPFYYFNDTYLQNSLIKNADESQISEFARIHASIMEQMDAYIGVRCHDNPFDASIPGVKKMSAFNRLYTKPVHFDLRIPKTKWCLLRYPTPVMAYQSQMPTPDFEDFYFAACLVDYAKMYDAMLPLKELMDRTDKVHIIAPDTDLTFSIKGIGATPCYGLRNIPDGEIYSAPVAHSVNGTIRFNTHSPHSGYVFNNISLTFENGKIIKANTDGSICALNDILDTDEGSRFLGEFALGVNPFINKAIGDTLFDEKIAGSIHLAVGNFCGNAYNGNRSAIHWDLVQIHTPEYGGGEIWFDDVLVRKDGLFVLDELKPLNPNNLKNI